MTSKEKGEGKSTNKQTKPQIGSSLSMPDCATEAQLRKAVKWKNGNHLQAQKEGISFSYQVLTPECYSN